MRLLILFTRHVCRKRAPHFTVHLVDQWVGLERLLGTQTVLFTAARNRSCQSIRYHCDRSGCLQRYCIIETTIVCSAATAAVAADIAQAIEILIAITHDCSLQAAPLTHQYHDDPQQPPAQVIITCAYSTLPPEVTVGIYMSAGSNLANMTITDCAIGTRIDRSRSGFDNIHITNVEYRNNARAISSVSGSLTLQNCLFTGGRHFEEASAIFFAANNRELLIDNCRFMYVDWVHTNRTTTSASTDNVGA
jgi:hypothetical protein